MFVCIFAACYILIIYECITIDLPDDLQHEYPDAKKDLKFDLSARRVRQPEPYVNLYNRANDLNDLDNDIYIEPYD